MDPEQVRAAAAEAAAASREADDEEPSDEDPDEEDDGQDVEFGADDWRAWTVFVACRRAWRIVAGFGGIYHDGIDPSAVRSTVDLLGIKRRHWPDLTWRLRILEDEARKHLNAKPDDD